MREFDPYAYEIHADPYPVYAALRAHAPVYRNERLGFWALSRHAWTKPEAAYEKPAITRRISAMPFSSYGGQAPSCQKFSSVA